MEDNHINFIAFEDEFGEIKAVAITSNDVRYWDGYSTPEEAIEYIKNKRLQNH